MHNLRTDLRSGIVLILFFGLVLFGVLPAQIDVPPSIEIRALAPDYWPIMVLWILIILSSLLAISTLWQHKGCSNSTVKPSPPSEINHRGYRVALIGMFIAYYCIIEPLGLAGASVILMPAMAVLYGEKRYLLLGASTLGLIGVLQIFFVKIANVPIPMGIFTM